MSDSLASIMEHQEPQRLATGFRFLEGPIWHPQGYLLFVDMRRRSLIYRLAPGQQAEIFRNDAGGASGLAFDTQGRLLMSEMYTRRVTRMEADGTLTPMAWEWQGKRLNGPTDVVCRSDGSIYFSDPWFVMENIPQGTRELDFMGLYRLSPQGKLTLEDSSCEFPDGLAFSPDERVLYVADPRAKQVMAFDLRPNGSLTRGRVFGETSGEEPGAPDGVKVDTEGRVYTSGPSGCWVFSASGKHLGTIPVPEPLTNMAFGGPDSRTLFFVAHTSVYSVRTKTPGVRAWRGNP